MVVIYSGHSCHIISNRYNSTAIPDSFLIPDCYHLYEFNHRLSDRAAQETLTVRDMSDCQQACQRSKYFDCRSIGFAADLKTGNCQLSDIDPRADAKTFDAELVKDYDFKVYERRSCKDDDHDGNGGVGDTSKVSHSLV